MTARLNVFPLTPHMPSIGFAALALALLLSGIANAQSFTVIGNPSNPTDFAKPNTYLDEGPTNTDILTASNPSPDFGITGNGFLGTNFLDVSKDEFNLGWLQLDQFEWPKAISAGFDPLDDTWDVFFSVSRNSTGQDSTDVRERADTTNAGVGADIFYNHNTQSFLGRNHWHRWGPQFGLEDVAGAEITSMELYDSRFAGEIPFTGFNGISGEFLDDLYFATGSSIRSLDLNTNQVSTVHDFASIGLDVGDRIDALAYDAETLDAELAPQIYESDGIVEALFSLQAGSPSLAGGLSPADIFYTNFDGTFTIAGPENIGWLFPLTAENIGLLPTDEVDGLDFAFTGGPVPAGDPDTLPPGPWPGPRKGDMNGDGRVDNFDIADFEIALVDPEEYRRRYPYHAPSIGDINDDGFFDNFDIGPFENLVAFGASGSTSIETPEPRSLCMLLISLSALLIASRRSSHWQGLST